MVDNKRCYIECDCGSNNDLLILEYWDGDEDWKFINSVEINQLIPGETFFQRLWHGIRHIFNGKKKWTGFSSTMVNYNTVKKIILFLQEFIEKQEEYIGKKEDEKEI
jgi:hypothetical protein